MMGVHGNICGIIYIQYVPSVGGTFIVWNFWLEGLGGDHSGILIWDLHLTYSFRDIHYVIFIQGYSFGDYNWFGLE